MIRKLFILFFFTAGLSAIAIAQFEGSIDMKVVMTDQGKPEEMLYTMSIKKNLMASEIKSSAKGGDGGKFIFRGDKQVLWIINDAEKSFLELSLKDEREKETKSTESSRAKVKKTGKKETILGYPCEEIIIEDGNEVTQLWGTAKLGDFYGELMKSFGQIDGKDAAASSSSWERELEALKLFPLKIVSKENGKITQTQEVTKIESKSIPASTFDVPKGYAKQKLEFDMGKMMKEMEEQMKAQKGKQKEADKDDPGMNIDMEKMMKQLQEMQEDKEDTTDGG